MDKDSIRKITSSVIAISMVAASVTLAMYEMIFGANLFGIAAFLLGLAVLSILKD